jgi:hypothetical protein
MVTLMWVAFWDDLPSLAVIADQIVSAKNGRHSTGL